MAKGFPTQPIKKQKKEIVGITPSEPTFGGVRGKETGPTSFFEQEPIRPISVSKKGIVQDVAGGTAPQDIRQLTPEQKAQLGISEEVDAEAILEKIRRLSSVEGRTSESLNQGASLPDTFPPPEQETPLTGQVKPPTSETAGDQVVDRFGVDKSLFGRATIMATPQEQATAISFGALGAGGLGGGFALKLSTNKALNTLLEALHFSKIYIGKAGKGILRGSAPKIGELAVNPKSAGLMKQIVGNIWGKLGITLTVLNMINSILDNGFDGTKYLNTVEEVKKAIRENNLAIEKESVPQIRQAYLEENEMLLKLEDEITNLDGWEALFKHIPILDNAAAKSIIAKGKRGISESEDRKARQLLEKYRIIQAQAGVIQNLDPDMREAIIEYAASRRQDIIAATALSEVLQ